MSIAIETPRGVRIELERDDWNWLLFREETRSRVRLLLHDSIGQVVRKQEQPEQGQLPIDGIESPQRKS